MPLDDNESNMRNEFEECLFQEFFGTSEPKEDSDNTPLFSSFSVLTLTKLLLLVSWSAWRSGNSHVPEVDDLGNELDAWVPDFEDDDDSLSSGEDAPIFNNDIEDSEVDKVSETSFIQEFDHVLNSVHDEAPQSKAAEALLNEETLVSEDPFGIYGLLHKNNNNNSGSMESVDPKFPPGFTPSTSHQEKPKEDHVQVSSNCAHPSSSRTRESKKNQGMTSFPNSHSGSFKQKAGGSIIDLMDELVNVGRAMGYKMDGCLGNKAKRRWINGLCHKHRINFMSLQETKMEDIDVCTIKEVWGNMYFDHVVGPSVGFSGGIVCIWNTNMFVKEHVSKSDYFVAIMGTWIPSSTRLLVISIYAPQELSEKRDLWNYLQSFISRWDGETVLMGDFNEVRSERERFGSVFNQQGATAFNQFISSSSLIDPPLDGYAFTWSHKNASKMSKLDRFLLSEGLFDFFPHLSAICLDKNLSDHRPILLRESCLDYGPTPFRFFHSWFSLDGFDAFVENTWNSLMVSDDNALIRLQRKLQLLKIAIKSWTKEFRLKSNAKKCQIQQDILCLDKLFDLGLINDDSLNKRALLLNELHEINSVNASELSQKAKIRWSIEGDENSKFFHGIINKKRAQLAIRGILADGNWISEPSLVKNEFFHHFSKQFSSPPSSYICLDYEFPVRLTSDQVEDLESEISNEEVKAAVWDCGVNKSPGPDGYTFEFFRKYWTFIGNDIIQAVKAFFANGCFPRGCNSSFIALIPKIQDAKFVKDFRPISLIGSTYKIISKILANRLCLVLPDLISDVQSAFVANRQILDGPFILNELMSWCKHTKFKGMIFKVDFEKAFDSVKWDYLDETLKSFGFGLKWRNWISGCLNNAKGSVLVNGNPTKEFQFFKGLKQGDPLSPFLFILVMETLHLSFKRIINAGLYRGISINGSLTLSHLFYADDVVFVGEWKDSNIHILLNVLKCFFLASGLKINLQKSKLMGLGVSSNVDDVISKVSSRLSKWKIKSLSIGGRLTLLKSVLTSIPLYHMSIFKVPMGVLKKLESIRRNFFNGHDGFARKSSWFNWNKALASKKNGGIGVSSFFAINRALLFKWVWRFFSDGSSLWSTFIKALFGFHGAIGLTVKPNRRSIWSDILQAVNSLKDKGIDFLQFIRKKIGNGVNTSFWADSWIGSIPFKEKFPRLYALEESKSISVADKLGLSSLYLSFRRPPRGGIEQESFNLLCQSVRGLVIHFASLNHSGLMIAKGTRRVCFLAIGEVPYAKAKFRDMDRLSNLPSSIIESILCLVPIQRGRKDNILSSEMEDIRNPCISGSIGGPTSSAIFECLPVIETFSISFHLIRAFGAIDKVPRELSITLIHLKYLRLDGVYFNNKTHLSILALLIISSLNLEKLKVFDNSKFEISKRYCFRVEDYSDIMLERLNELEITSFINAKNQLDFVRLILARSLVLKKVRIFPHSKISMKEKSKIKLQILRDSVIYPCASPEVQIIVVG
ncbi:RNA-directed DNA polymerase, eukaryota [Tanacetum coccineum]